MSDTAEALRDWIRVAGGVAGTLHLVEGETLRLVAAWNIPDQVVRATTVIPKGKGMAGLAWSRVEPVQTCNLREDETGDVRPGAKAVDARGAVAIPLLGNDDLVRAVVGVAFADERELTKEAISDLTARAVFVLDSALSDPAVSDPVA